MARTPSARSKRFRRHDGRKADELRPVSVEVDYLPHADGSCLIGFGDTRVICTVSFMAGVPEWLTGRGTGWVTAEYAMLPASTHVRKRRPIGRPDGRGTEIQRLIGRVCRGSVRMDRLGENTLFVDCDVISADGGTRTAAITGGQIALARALAAAESAGAVRPGTLATRIAAVSVAVVDGVCLLDPDYVEDSTADVDANVAVTAAGQYVEIQTTAERAALRPAQLEQLLTLARRGCRKLHAVQKTAIAE